MVHIEFGSVAEWVAALSAAAIVPLSYLTLLKVREYTDTTQAQFNLSQQQLEAQQRPVIVFVGTSKIEFKNIGNSPAMNVRYLGYENRRSAVWGSIGALAPNGLPVLLGKRDDLEVFQLNQSEGKIEEFCGEVHYQSLAGVRYTSIVRWSTSVMNPPFTQEVQQTNSPDSKHPERPLPPFQ